MIILRKYCTLGSNMLPSRSLHSKKNINDFFLTFCLMLGLLLVWSRINLFVNIKIQKDTINSRKYIHSFFNVLCSTFCVLLSLFSAIFVIYLFRNNTFFSCILLAFFIFLLTCYFCYLLILLIQFLKKYFKF